MGLVCGISGWFLAPVIAFGTSFWDLEMPRIGDKNSFSIYLFYTLPPPPYHFSLLFQPYPQSMYTTSPLPPSLDYPPYSLLHTTALYYSSHSNTFFILPPSSILPLPPTLNYPLL